MDENGSQMKIYVHDFRIFHIFSVLRNLNNFFNTKSFDCGVPSVNHSPE